MNLTGRNSGGDPVEPIVGKVAAVIAGNDHVKWLSMSQETREGYYQQAVKVINIIFSSEYFRTYEKSTGVVSKP